MGLSPKFGGFEGDLGVFRVFVSVTARAGRQSSRKVSAFGVDEIWRSKTLFIISNRCWGFYLRIKVQPLVNHPSKVMFA